MKKHVIPFILLAFCFASVTMTITRSDFPGSVVNVEKLHLAIATNADADIIGVTEYTSNVLLRFANAPDDTETNDIMNLVTNHSTNFTWPTLVTLPPFRFLMNSTVYTGENIQTLLAEKSCTIDHVIVRSLNDPTGAAIKIDINVNGTSVWGADTNLLWIRTNTYSNSRSDFSNTSISAMDYVSFSIDQIGSGDAGGPLMINVVVK